MDVDKRLAVWQKSREGISGSLSGVTSDVSQESVLGLQLFAIYINYLDKDAKLWLLICCCHKDRQKSKVMKRVYGTYKKYEYIKWMDKDMANLACGKMRNYAASLSVLHAPNSNAQM